MRRRLDKRTLLIDVVSYVIVNLFLVIVWAISGRGYFWPLYFMACGGVSLLFAVYLRKPVRELGIDEELHRKFPSNGG